MLTNRVEKSLRHFAMVAKFLDAKKPKTSLYKWICTVSNFINLIQIHLICEMLAKFSVVEIIQKYQVSLEKENFCVMFMYSKKWAHKIRKFHATVSAQSCNNGKKNAQKSVMQVQSCCLPT